VSVKRSFSRKLTVGLIGAAAALTVLPAWADLKIAVVNPQKLVEESPQGKAVQEAMRAEFAPRQRTLQQTEANLKAKQERLQKDAATMSDDQRVKADKELRDGARDLQRAEGEFNDDVQARRNEELSRLQRTLLEEVRTYAKGQNYDIVLSGEAVLYSASATDITPAVLSALQARGGAAGASSTTTPAKPPAK
jgi:outer membrane protein